MSNTYRRLRNKIQQNSNRSVRKTAIQENENLSKRSAPKIGLLTGLLLVVCAAVLAAHWPALSAQSLSFDDDQYLLENQLVQNPSWTSARRFLTEVLEPSSVEGYYQPLAMISLMLDYAMGGRPDNLTPFHITSLCLHIINTSLVIVLLYMLFDKVWPAIIVGLLFAVHPMTVESIPWVGERKTLLAAFFALSCLILYVRFTRKSNWRLYISCLIMYVLALMSKPTSLPLPALMLLMDYWPLRRLKQRAVVEKLPFFVIGGISAIVTYVSQSRTSFTALPSEYHPGHIPLVLCHNIIFYLYKIIWPVNLSSHYPFPRPLAISDPMVLAGVIGTCVLLVLLLISLRWTRALLTGWLFFFVAIFPTMGVIGFTNVIASDKFAYLPSVGLLMVLAWLLGRLWTRVSGSLAHRIIIVVFILAVATSESIATRRYLVHWQTTEGLYKYMLGLTPNVSILHFNYANALREKGQLDRAIKHFNNALRINPRYSEARSNLGLSFLEVGKYDEAIKHFNEALRLKPNLPNTINNLAVALREQGKINEAIKKWKKALEIEPSHPYAHFNMGRAMTGQRKYDEAIEHFNQALQSKPDYLKARINLARILLELGRVKPAVEQYYQILKLKPQAIYVLNDLAWILATTEDKKIYNPPNAVELAQKACELTKYNQPQLLDTLAVAYAAAGNFGEAIETAERALNLALSSNQQQLADEIKNHLELYRHGQAYREPSRAEDNASQ